jgi:hypothetical protein
MKEQKREGNTPEDRQDILASYVLYDAIREYALLKELALFLLSPSIAQRQRS